MNCDNVVFSGGQWLASALLSTVGGVSGWRDGDHDVRQSYGRRQGDHYDGRRQNFRNDDNWQGFVGRREAANSNDRGFQSRLDGDYGTGPRESGHRDDYQDNRQYDDKQDRPGGEWSRGYFVSAWNANILCAVLSIYCVLWTYCVSC